MSLPMDFSTALWWRSVPRWEWEPLPPPPAGDVPAPPADGDRAARPALPAGGEREGFRLVFKGYQISASLFWYPADSALSRPWLRHDDTAGERRVRSPADAAARIAADGADGDDGKAGPA